MKRLCLTALLLSAYALAAVSVGCGLAGESVSMEEGKAISDGGPEIRIEITDEPIRAEPVPTAPEGLTPDPALAEISETGEADWALEDGVLTISGSGVLEERFWEKEYHDETVQSITKVLIGNGIIDLPYSAFGDHDSLVSASIGDGFTYVPSETFIGCTSLKQVSFGKNVTFIDGGAFERCGLEEIAIPDTISFINIGAFANCTDLEKILIPASVTEIGEDAFKNCEKLTVFAPEGSFAETYARENGIPFFPVP